MAVIFALALSFAGTPAQGQAPGVTLYVNGDTNIQDMYEKKLLPMFEKETGLKTKMILLEHGNGSEGILAKIIAAKRTNRPVDVDFWETQPTFVQQGASENIWTRLDASNLPNLSKVDPKRPEVSGFGVPYRGSSVVLAYNSKYIQTPPKTYDELIAWIKKNPGKFTYCDPNTGGSGQAMVYDAIYKFVKPDDYITLAYDPAKTAAWEPAFQLLRSLKPAIYNNGFYPNGNTAILQLLARENIWMATVWSDQATSYLDQGLLPKTVKLTQINPPFTGGDSTIAIPAGAEHQATGLMFLNWLLNTRVQAVVVETLAAYPGIEWKYMPKGVRDKFAGIAVNFNPLPNAKYQADAKRLWQEKVAGSGQ
jgi:putative spermidine/putrescine transport system substrate-binding protein